MLSSLIEIMNRERALSFSAALCLLTVTAAALPGLFQEDDPFNNASLWEGTSSDGVSSSVEVSTVSSAELEQRPSTVHDESAESFVSLESETSVDAPSTSETTPELELNAELVDPVEEIESLVDHPSPTIETHELELEDPGILDVGLETPMLESELIESATEEMELDENIELTQVELTQELELVEEEVEADPGDSILDSPEDSPEATELEAQLDSDSQLELATDSQQNFDIQVDNDEVAPQQDSDQDTLLEAPNEDGQSDENVYRGELWIAPPTSEPPTSEELPDTSQGSVALPSESAEFAPLPAQVYPEYDWSQSTIEFNEVLPSGALNTPLQSPQVLSGDYQPFAAGNPALGGSVELNPLVSNAHLAEPHSEPQSWTEYSDMVLDVPQGSSFDPSFDTDSFEQPIDADFEPSQPVNTYQGGDYGAYEPVCAGQCHEPMGPSGACQNPMAIEAQCSAQHQAKACCPLVYCLNRGLSRLKLRSFKLCPCRQVAGCQECGQSQSSHGCGLKNWLLSPPTHRPVCSLGKWLLQPPTRRPVCSLGRWLLQPPTRRPVRSLGRWLLQTPTHTPVRNFGRWLFQPATFTPVRNFRSTLFDNSLQPSHGLPSRLYNGSNTFS